LFKSSNEKRAKSLIVRECLFKIINKKEKIPPMTSQIDPNEREQQLNPTKCIFRD